MSELHPWQERESRSSTCVGATLTSARDSRDPVAVFITNISNRGCRIMGEAAFDIGETVRISLPRLGSMSARVRWSNGRHSGAEFIAGSDAWAAAEDEADEGAARAANA